MADWKINLKYNLLKLIGRYKYLNTKIKCNKEWYGNSYGGFFVNPDVLSKNSIVYSFGIGEDVSFDEAVIKKVGCKIYAFDPTPKSINWVKASRLPMQFVFNDFGINDKDETVDFYLPKNTDYVSGSMVTQKCVDENNKVPVLMKTISTITEELGHKYIDVLKMDVEGAEYHVIDDVLASGVEIGQILIEVHDRLFVDGEVKTKKMLAKLERAGYFIFGVSKTFEEISLIHKRNLSLV